MQDFAYGVVVGKVLAQTVRLAFAMPVRAAGHQQIVPCGNRQQSFALFRRIAAMPYFKPSKPSAIIASSCSSDSSRRLRCGSPACAATTTPPAPLTAAMTSCVDGDGVGM